jgi:hypothetical protein
MSYIYVTTGAGCYNWEHSNLGMDYSCPSIFNDSVEPKDEKE